MTYSQINLLGILLRTPHWDWAVPPFALKNTHIPLRYWIHTMVETSLKTLCSMLTWLHRFFFFADSSAAFSSGDGGGHSTVDCTRTCPWSHSGVGKECGIFFFSYSVTPPSYFLQNNNWERGTLWEKPNKKYKRTKILNQSESIWWLELIIYIYFMIWNCKNTNFCCEFIEKNVLLKWPNLLVGCDSLQELRFS